MRAILLIDHGSVRPEANHMLVCMENLLQAMVGRDVLVRHAHMELATPSIAEGFAACVASGATEVIVFPYMLSPGKHVTRDIPRFVAEAASPFPRVAYRVTAAFGVHEKLAELIAQRAGVEMVHSPRAADDAAGDAACTCWDPDGVVGACGPACAARPAGRLASAP